MIGTLLVVQWLGLCLPTQGARVQSLVREVKSHILCGGAKRKKKKDKRCLLNQSDSNNQEPAFLRTVPTIASQHGESFSTDDTSICLQRSQVRAPCSATVARWANSQRRSGDSLKINKRVCAVPGYETVHIQFGRAKLMQIIFAFSDSCCVWVFDLANSNS